jgi:hypothetical protein
VNKKKTTYLLLITVIIVWVLIIVRIFGFVKKDSFNIPEKVKLQKSEQQIQLEDSIILIANYPDPFFGNITNQKSIKKRSKNISVKPKTRNIQNNIPVKWPVIQFDGTIQSANKIQGLLRIDNEQFFISESEIYNNVLIKKIYSDSVTVIYQNHCKSIKK